MRNRRQVRSKVPLTRKTRDGEEAESGEKKNMKEDENENKPSASKAFFVFFHNVMQFSECGDTLPRVYEATSLNKTSPVTQ